VSFLFLNSIHVLKIIY